MTRRLTGLPAWGLPAWGLAAGLGVAALAAPAWAVQPDEILPDPALEARAREISQGLRCVVCQSENIDESNADLARDMRVRVRDLLKEGRSDDEVVSFMVDRYGDYVLMKPPFKLTTFFLWIGPALVLIAGAVGVARFYRRRDAMDLATAAPAALSDDERRRLERLLDHPDPASPSPASPSPSPSPPSPPDPADAVTAADKETRA